VKEKENTLYIKAVFNCDKINLYYPAMDDMRTARTLLKIKHLFTVKERGL